MDQSLQTSFGVAHLGSAALYTHLFRSQYEEARLYPLGNIDYRLRSASSCSVEGKAAARTGDPAPAACSDLVRGNCGPARRLYEGAERCREALGGAGAVVA